MIVFATARHARKHWVAEVLRAAELHSELAVVHPSRLCHVIFASDPSLVLFDGQSALSWEMMAGARVCAPGCRFVLCAQTVTPSLVRAAVESGLNGVISTSLPVEDAAQTLQRIWSGEQLFRFDSKPRRGDRKAAAAAGSDFDGQWMFGTARDI
jgi:hypothetical protein